MSKNVVAGICGLTAAITVCALSWLLGFDFDERGNAAFFTAYVALLVAAAAFAFARAVQGSN